MRAKECVYAFGSGEQRDALEPCRSPCLGNDTDLALSSCLRVGSPQLRHDLCRRLSEVSGSRLSNAPLSRPQSAISPEARNRFPPPASVLRGAAYRVASAARVRKECATYSADQNVSRPQFAPPAWIQLQRLKGLLPSNPPADNRECCHDLNSATQHQPRPSKSPEFVAPVDRFRAPQFGYFTRTKLFGSPPSGEVNSLLRRPHVYRSAEHLFGSLDLPSFNVKVRENTLVWVS